MNAPIRILLSLLLLCLAPREHSAQDDPCAKILIPLTLRDARGELIHNYSDGDLEVKLGGTAQHFEGIHRETRSRRMVILLDASGSMKDPGKGVLWQRAIASTQFLANFSKRRAHLALLIFNKKIVEEIGFSDDNAAIAKKLDELAQDQKFLDQEVQGTTHLYDAMNRAMEMLGQPSSADVLFVVSDAGENGSRLHFADIKRKLIQTGVRVFMTRLENAGTNNRIMSPEEVSSVEDTLTVVEQTGGADMTLAPNQVTLGFQARPRPSVTEGFRMFYRGLFENDVLEFGGPLPNPGKRELKITVSASGRNRLNGAKLTYPHQLYFCTPPKEASAAP